MMPGRSVLLINPNATQAMTEAMGRVLRGHLPGAIAIEAVTSIGGPAVIATRATYDAGTEAVVASWDEHRGGHAAVIVGCFGDPGLERLRAMAGVPVIGLAEASFTLAARAVGGFGVITIGPGWRALLQERLALHPKGGRCRGVRALPGDGLDMTRQRGEMLRAIDAAARDLVASGVDTIVLGGGALAGLAPELSARACFIDCIAAAAAEVRDRIGV